MKTINIEKVLDNITALFISSVLIGFIAIYFIQITFLESLSMSVYISWSALCGLLYLYINHIKMKQSSTFDFYKVAEPVGRQARRKKQHVEERVGIHIDDDGLDPVIIFNEEKSGVASLIKLTSLNQNHKLLDYVSDFAISMEQQGHPIAGQTLFSMSYQEQSGYFRITSEENITIAEFAFLEKEGTLYNRVAQIISLLTEENSEVKVNKVDVKNFQAMFKFYNYVQRLTAPENRSIEYISYCKNALKICNSSYVELYDCNLQSTLTSWINQDGLIRTDNVDVELSENDQLHLTDIELPYNECRLTNIQIANEDDPNSSVKLHLTLVELKEGELTDNVSGLTLLMEGDYIAITQNEPVTDDLISVAKYFEQKSYPKF